MALHEYDEAALCFKKVLSLDEKNTAVLADIAKLKRAVKEYKESRKKMSERMISKLFTSDSDFLTASGDAVVKELVDEAAEHSESSPQHRLPESEVAEGDHEVSSNSTDKSAVQETDTKEDELYPLGHDSRTNSFAISSIIAFIALLVGVYYLVMLDPASENKSSG
jgi:hypothetical protein